MPRVAVIGGGGYLGDAVTDYLLEDGLRPVVYDALLYEDRYLKDTPFIHGDVRDHDRLAAALKGIDVVIWLAAIVGDGACALNPTETVEVNERSVEWLANNFDGKIFFMSTCSVYGCSEGLLDETSRTNPLSLYAGTKLNCESSLARKNAVILRLGTLYGIGGRCSRLRTDLVVNTMSIRAVTKRSLEVYGGEQYRPILHVKDAADFIATHLDTSHTGIFNIHSENIRIVDLAASVQQVVGDCEVKVTPTKFEDSRNYRVTSGKLISTFGWSSRKSVVDGIKEVADLVRSRRIKNPELDLYSNERWLRAQRA